MKEPGRSLRLQPPNMRYCYPDAFAKSRSDIYDVVSMAPALCKPFAVSFTASRMPLLVVPLYLYILYITKKTGDGRRGPPSGSRPAVSYENPAAEFDLTIAPWKRFAVRPCLTY